MNATTVAVDLAKNVFVRPASRLSLCFTGGLNLTKPIVPSIVPYPDMRGWQRLGVKLWGQCSHRESVR
jgi:hypothetical protein